MSRFKTCRPHRFHSPLHRIRFQDVYNIMLRNGWTLGTAPTDSDDARCHSRASHDAQVHEIGEILEKRRPDLVVSLIPHYNRALWEALQHTCPAHRM